MARLPTVGGDDGNWGSVLNDFLGQEHNTDGTHKSSIANSALKYVTVLDYGADSTGAANSDAAFAAAYAASSRVYIPPGTYKLTSFTPPTRSFTFGAGEGSKITYAGTGTLCTLTNLQRVKLKDLQFVVSDPAGILFTLDNSFRCTFTNVIFQGQHTTANDAYAVTTGHIGVLITGNAGDNIFYDCDFLNLGVGIQTDSIQNAVIGGKFGTCYVGIHGTSYNGRVNSGMALSGYIDFVSSFPNITVNNILIDNAAGQWWLSDCWFEGADVPIQVGAVGVGGPTQFGMINCKVAGTTYCLDLQYCRQPYLDNIQFSSNGSNIPTSLRINAGVTEGTAINLISIITGDPAISGSDYPSSLFPNGWTYIGRTNLRAPSNVNLAYGSAIRMARSDGAFSNTLQVTGGPTLLFRGPGSNVSPVIKVIDSGGSDLLEIDSVSNSVNQLAVVPAITGSPAKLASRGTDTNVGIIFSAKGNGTITAVSNSVTNTLNDGSGNIIANKTVAVGSGATGSRPTVTAVGSLWFDTTLGKPIWWNGSVWKDAAGTTV